MRISLLILLVLSGCSSTGVDRADQNKITKEFYASIDSVKQVKLSSQVKSGIAGGAVIGVIDEIDGNHEDMIAGGLAGALVGGLFTAFLEGGNEAYEYKLTSESEGEFTLIQKDKIDIHTGCAKVRVSVKTSIQTALKDNC
jgi:outer membrane lipoprotein SlyB